MEANVAVCPKNRVKITNDEWFEISRGLEPHHAVFYQVWQMGKPVFDETIPTACVQFDQNGNFILFRFNPEFWESCSSEKKLFVIAHEAVHVVLNHGSRAKDAGINSRAANVAMDLVVNHTLIKNFGFDRKVVDENNEYCWIDTVFPDKKPEPPTNETFEYYYNLFEKVYGDGGPGDGENGGFSTVDDHSTMASASSDDMKKVIENLNESLSSEEKESLKSTVEKHFQKDPTENSQAGTGTGGQWTFIAEKKVKKKQKWETVIKKWARKHMKMSDKDVEQWARLNRRLVMLPRDMILPSEMEVDDYENEKNKIDVWFFLDTSGSCWNLKDRFFAAAESLPDDRFNVRLFCFDTAVQETTLASRQVYGGGGTAFSIIENHIQMLMKKESCKYPSVFVITDGYGDHIRPAEPDKWHWFLTEYSTKSYIPSTCNFYELTNFE